MGQENGRKTAGAWSEQLPPARDVLLKGEPNVVRTTGGLHHMVSRLMGEEAVGFDLETTGLCPHINTAVLIGFGVEGGESWIVDLTALVPELQDWQPGEPEIDPLREIGCPEALQPLKEFLEDPQRPVLVRVTISALTCSSVWRWASASATASSTRCWPIES